MATIVIDNSTWIANGGVFNAASGDVFVIDPGLIYSTTINGATDFSVNFDQSNPYAIVVATGLDSRPTFNWADNVDTRLTTIAANYSATTTFNVGSGATIYDVQGALFGPNDFNFGNYTTVVANVYGGTASDTLTTGSNFEVTYGSIILGRETDIDGQGDVINIGPNSFVNGWVQTGYGSDSITIGDGFTSNGSIVSYGSLSTEPGAGDTIVIGNNVSILGNIWMLGVATGADLSTVSGTNDATVNSLTIGDNYTSAAGGIVGPFGSLNLTVGSNWNIAGVIYTYYGADNVVLGSSLDSPLVMLGQTGNDSLIIERLNPSDYVQYDGGLQDGGAMDVLTINNLTPEQRTALETTLSSAGYTLGADGLWHSSNPAQWEYFYVGNNLYSDWESVGLHLASGNGNGIVDGTDLGDSMGPGYIDADGDQIDGTDGLDDVIAGNGGNDTINAGLGNDTVDGGTGDDVIDGGDGNDQISGGEGADVLAGGLGNDLLAGGLGNDTLIGGDGADTLEGGAGNDSLDLGLNDNVTDTVIFSDGAGNDIVTNFTAPIDNGDGTYTTGDKLNVSGLTDANGNPVNAADVVVSDDGNGNAVLTFPNGESITLIGVAPSQIDSFRELAAAGIPCFATGTMIETLNGPVAIENLRVGDLVETLDHGFQPIRWIGSRKLENLELLSNRHLRPVRIRAGALGSGMPEQDLLVSPQHRMLVQSKIAMRMFGKHEVLVAAKQLVVTEGVDVEETAKSVEYFHMLFDRHQIVFAEGAMAESLYTGQEALMTVGAEALAEILQILPELRRLDPDNLPTPARQLVRGRLARKLALRHSRNETPLFDTRLSNQSSGATVSA